MTKHRPTETAIRCLEYLCSRDCGDYFSALDVKFYLQEEMDNPPSESTITRILQQFREMDYIRLWGNEWTVGGLIHELRPTFYRHNRED